jgi:trehalose 6-phosphate synthase
VSGRLIVVSNRVALPREVRAGGLASALHAALAEHGGIWFGWSGNVTDDAGARRIRSESAGAIEYEVADMTREEYERYYLGFANRTLWPLLHYRPSLLDYRREDFAVYRRVNRELALRVARRLRDGDLVWVHDYHLIPLGHELRALGVGARLGFYLHIPLPPRALLAMLPHHEHLFPLLADYDLVGVQTRTDLDGLIGYFTDERAAERGADGLLVPPGGRPFRAAALPISIDTMLVAEQARRSANSAATQRLVRSLDGRRLVIGVDRLDYSKGLPQRFEGFARFLALHEAWRSRVSFLQIATPTREEVPEYRELRSRLERLAGSTNGRYAEPDWVPIRYVGRSFSQATLAGFYRSADVGLVTPLRDGMNLVAKEYVAAQPPDDPGVLILSSFAGAADELAQAITINPVDIDDIAECIEVALTMPLGERRARWQAMFDHLREHDIAAWRGRFIAALSGP